MQDAATRELGAAAVAPGARGRAGAVLELLAVGGLVPLLFPLSWLLRRTLGLDDAELLTGATFFYLAHVLNDPHFAVTYLLFYRDARTRWLDPSIVPVQRARYVLAGFVVPAVLVVWALGALLSRSPQALGWMVQLMFLLVGWHYAKQAFGVLMVLSARRGVSFSLGERRVILAHALSAWAFAWANPPMEAGLFEEKGVVYWALPRPPEFELVSGAVLVVSTIAFVVVLGRRWRRREALAAGPLLAFLSSIWLLTVLTSIDPLVRYAVPALHALQYGYFVWLMTRNEARAHEGPPSFGPPVRTRLSMLALGALALGWVLFSGAPDLLDAWIVPGWHTTREDLGPTPFLAAFATVVNIHHYFMDHVIWRREHATSRWLARDPPPATALAFETAAPAE